jgi:ribosomal protein L20
MDCQINAAAREEGINYSKFMGALAGGKKLDRKNLYALLLKIRKLFKAGRNSQIPAQIFRFCPFIK